MCKILSEYVLIPSRPIWGGGNIMCLPLVLILVSREIMRALSMGFYHLNNAKDVGHFLLLILLRMYCIVRHMVPENNVTCTCLKK